MKYCFHIILIIACLAGSGYARFSDSDLNQDGVVDYTDLQQLGGLWLDDCFQSSCFNVDIKEDGIVNFSDFSRFSANWKITDYNSSQIGYWKFDEGSGAVAHDSTSYGHNAQLKNMNSSWTSGKRAGALYFDGSNDYLLISALSNGLGQHFKRDFSISVWINQYSPQSGYQTVIGIESTSDFIGYGFEGFTIEIDDGLPYMYIAYSDDQREVVPSATALQPDKWQHLCIVREGSALKFYIDGKLDNYQTITDANIKFGSAWPGYDTIGDTYDGYYGHNALFHGKLDDIHLYNFAIPESLVRKLAQQDYAWMPEPQDGSANVSVDSNLCWQKGLWSGDYNGHDVYFGTDYDQVNNADVNTAMIYMGRQTSRLFDPCTLNPNTFYYWRVDDVNGTQKHKGSVWSFRTSDLVSSIVASSSQPGFGPEGAYDGYRFESTTGQCWKGAAGQGSWSWQANFTTPRSIGSVLMIMGEPGEAGGELEFYQNNAPLSYKWQYSNDGSTWIDLEETIVTDEKRMFRIHRFNTAIEMEHLRLEIFNCIGSYPTIREIEFYSDTNSVIPFDDWLVAVDITSEPGPPYGNTSWFVHVARRCSGWSEAQAQQLWLADFDESFLNIEPHPLCVFISGSFDEWCQVNRTRFGGLQEVVVNGHIPIWGSCGGAQVLGLLLDPGSENPWDCPRCRLLHNPAWSPIYGHIGYINPAIEPSACGDYSNCIREEGACRISKMGTSDPVFAGLSNPFYAYENHIGQVEYLPAGWHRIGGSGGSETKTYYQCFRRDDRYIYGAQFHIENDYNTETNNNATQIMTNFLGLAQQWGGYQPSK
jgi:hypothetical protein